MVALLCAILDLQEDSDFWREHGQEEIENAFSANDPLNKNVAKNVVLMIGDGLDLPTVTATRIFKVGESGQLVMETLPHTGMAKVLLNDFTFAHVK